MKSPQILLVKSHVAFCHPFFLGHPRVCCWTPPQFARVSGAPCTEPNARLARRVPVAGAVAAAGAGTTPILKNDRLEVSLEGSGGEEFEVQWKK